MSEFLGAGIVEIRVYDDPSNPENSTYTVSLPITVLEAVLDTNTGKNLKTILAEYADDISAANTSANSAKDSAGANAQNISSLQAKVSAVETTANNAAAAAQTAQQAAANASSALSNHTHPASQITGLPTSLPANGGNADTVDGEHVVTTAALGLHKMSGGTAAATSSNCPPGAWYGQYE